MRRLLNLLLTFTLSLAAIMVLAWGVVAAPTTHHVAPHADAVGATPCYVTLQAAIDAAQTGGETKTPRFDGRGVGQFQNLNYPRIDSMNKT